MSNTAEIQFDDLNFLLKATSRQQVIDLLNKAFEYKENKMPISVLQQVSEVLSISSEESLKVMTAISNLIKTALFKGLGTTQQVSVIFPENFHKNLADLLTKIIVERYPYFKAKSVESLVSLPKAIDYSWRVDMKMASGTEAQISQPTCILHLKIEDPSLPLDHKEKLTSINIELSKEQVDVMMDHLSRVRDQLGAVAKK